MLLKSIDVAVVTHFFAIILEYIFSQTTFSRRQRNHQSEWFWNRLQTGIIQTLRRRLAQIFVRLPKVRS